MQKLRQFSRDKLALVLGVYIVLQPLLDILTALGANAEMPITVGVVVRSLAMLLGFLYVVFVSRTPAKKGCLIVLGIMLAYLAAFMLHLLRIGGIGLCLENAQETVKTFFAPFVLVFLYAVYREFGHLVSIRAIAWAGGIYVSVILLAAITGTSFISYSNSGYGYKGWFYAANEVSCIIALSGPLTIYYCLKALPTVTKKTWWKGALIAWTLFAVAFSANFLGTKIIFGVTTLYCLAALIWSMVRLHRDKNRLNRLRAIVLAAVCALTVGIYAISPLQGYLNNIYLEMMDKESELRIISWGKEIQEASEGTWLREKLKESEGLQLVDHILSARLLSASPSVQVYTDGDAATKLLGIGYADTPSYDRSIWFMIEMDPPALLIRHGLVGFAVYILPYLAFVVWMLVKFFQKPAKRFASLLYATLLFSSLWAFAIATIAGHALVSPAVATFALVIGMQLWHVTHVQDRGELPGAADDF